MADKLTPLEALKLDPNAITKVVYGSDHPSRKQRKSPPQKAPRGGTLVGDLIPADTKRKLSALQGKLEARQRRMNKGGKS